MIIETIIDERLVKHESDRGFMMRQVETDSLYSEAIDVRPCRYTYEETDILIEQEDVSDGEIAQAVEAIL